MNHRNARADNSNNSVAEPDDALSPISFDHLPSMMAEAVQRAGWTDLTPVQSRGIPYLRAHRDMMVQARTGSGKTGAFVLPILEGVDIRKRTCQALVLVPTRELAQQVSTEAKLLAGEKGMHVVSVYGGASYKPQIKGFKEGAHLVVGTPGRTLDHLVKRNFSLDKLKFLIFDEADRMLSMGFYPDMVRIQEQLPSHRVHTCMFSATIPPQVQGLARRFMKEAGFLSLSRDHVHVEDTEHVYYLTPGMDKDRALVRIIEMENPFQTIIFCNTRDRVNYVTAVLQRFGYNADQISSDLTQSVRDKVLKRLRNGELRFLVATDVAARGIDIPELTHVIQYEPSPELEAYIHRAGRTGRAGSSGTAIMLVNHNEKRSITRIAAHYKIEFVERTLPRDEDVANIVSQRLIGQLEARLRERDRLKVERMQRFKSLTQELAGDDDGLMLLEMLLDDTYHDWMHKPPELPPLGSQAVAKKSYRSKRKSRSKKPRKRK